MNDLRSKLQQLFQPQAQYSQFGKVLTSVVVRGFRCHADTFLEFNSPITAFCGLNGTGKSTLLHILASAYRSPYDPDERYYIRDFIVAGTLDKTPFAPGAYVEYSYLQEDRKLQKVTVSRDGEDKRWRGYKRQPQREVYFAGMGLYLPRIEARDFIVEHAAKLVLDSSSPIPARSQEWICRILACHYDVVSTNKVGHNGRFGEVVTVTRHGSTYSEANMGCGEGRVQHIINALESLPDRSLVLLEEPETSLHPSAQHEFGRYLVDMCLQKRHQIFLTTHSKYLLTALPQQSRIYLDRTTQGLRFYSGLSTSHTASLMTGGHDKAIHVLVEDDVAEAVLNAILRRADPTFLKAVQITIGGSAETLSALMKTLNTTGLPVAAVRDGDMGESPRENLFKLPGALPPERELLQSQAVRQELSKEYDVDIDDFFAQVRGLDHHQWLGRLAQIVHTTKPALLTQLAKVYVAALPENEVVPLAELLKATIKI